MIKKNYEKKEEWEEDQKLPFHTVQNPEDKKINLMVRGQKDRQTNTRKDIAIFYYIYNFILHKC